MATLHELRVLRTMLTAKPPSPARDRLLAKTSRRICERETGDSAEIAALDALMTNREVSPALERRLER